MMSYRGEVSYQQRGPPERNSYYYGGDRTHTGPSQQGPYQRTDELGPADFNFHQGYDRQRGGPQADHSRDQQPSYAQPEERFRDQQDVRPPTHRYPETFQRNTQHPPAGESSWERRNDTNHPPRWAEDPQSRSGDYGRQFYRDQSMYNYQDRGQSIEQSNHNQEYWRNQDYESYSQAQSYQQQGDGRVRNDRENFQAPHLGRQNDFSQSQSWHDENRSQNNHPQSNYATDHRTRDQHLPMDNADYCQTASHGVRSPSNWAPGASSGYHQPHNTLQRDEIPPYNKPEPPFHSEYQHNGYRDSNYRQQPQSNSRPAAEPPQVLAKTSGSTAVFGIVARVDSSPTRQQPHLASPTRTNAQPSTSPTRDYSTPYEKYGVRDPPFRAPPTQTPQQHQYHHALTPISEKPSPPSSISSRGHPPETGWSLQKTTEGQSHFGQREKDSIQSWQAPSERSYKDQHPEHRNRPNYNDPHGQYPDRQRQPQQSRPGYRDYEYTESSGYGSESTHYTERSYNNEQQIGHYNSQLPVPPSQRQGDNWQRSPTGSYSHSPPRRPDPDHYGQHYRGGGELTSSSQVPQHNVQRNENSYQERFTPSEKYGPPVSIENRRPHDDKQSHPPQNHYRPQDHNRQPPPSSNSLRPNSPSSYMGGHSSRHYGNTESGVEESHVKSVRAAKNMFEKKSDPRRPPPAPKPILAPKLNVGGSANVNARPVPPRPRNLSEGRWNQEPVRNQYPANSQEGLVSPRSPHDAFRPNQPYEQRSQPSHSQSMDNLDDRSRYHAPPPQKHPQHAQSLQNLSDRTRYPEQHDQGRLSRPPEPSEGYRSYSGQGPSQERPMVLAVKYNPDKGPSVYTRQDESRLQGSREMTRKDLSWQSDDHRPQQQFSPTKPHPGQERSSWSAEPHRSNQQSYTHNARNSAPNQEPLNRPERRSSVNENRNFVPDVVARSYELASQSQQRVSGSQSDAGLTPYSNHSQQTERNNDYQSRPPNYQNAPENRNSTDRWPTPPPPLSQNRPQHIENQDQEHRYTDDWRRPGPPPQHQTQLRDTRQNAPLHGQRPSYPVGQEPQGYPSENPQGSQLPPPPQQPYQYDSDSSEVDVDAPTPPPMGKNLRPRHLNNHMRSESPYERNKPIPITSRNPPDSRRSIPNEMQNDGEPQVASQQEQGLSYSRGHPQTTHSQMSPQKQQPSGTKCPPPQKPQRNSTSLSPQSGGPGEQKEFSFNVGATQRLKHPSSRERQRLGKSGALANRKPPSRNNSSSNLVENENDNNYQIEVTDSDISAKATIEVHREESMRILRAAKKDKDSSSETQSTVLERPSKQRASQKAVASPPSDQGSERPTNMPSKKVDSKLVYKVPPAGTAKTVPMPQVTEPAGFGYTPEKPKTDLLSQFKSARDSAMRTAAEKQDRALKSVSALVKFSQGKKEAKAPPKPKLTPAERNAKLLDKMNVEVKALPEEDNRSRHHHHKDHDERSNPVRSSTRSSSTVKPEKYDGDDDTTNGSRHEHDRRGRVRDRGRDHERAKSRGRSTSRGRNLSPEDKGGRSRHRSKSRERSLSPEDRRRPRRDLDDRKYDERRRHGEGSSYHRRPPTPDRHRYRDDDRYYPRSPQHRPYPQPYDRQRAAREPDWVEQFRRGREASNQPSRRAWVNDPRRVEVTVEGRRRELDMDAFEREVKKATSYNSDFEQPEPRRQMIPTKLSTKTPANPKRQPPGDWMNALKERNRSAARARHMK